MHLYKTKKINKTTKLQSSCLYGLLCILFFFILLGHAQTSCAQTSHSQTAYASLSAHDESSPVSVSLSFARLETAPESAPSSAPPKQEEQAQDEALAIVWIEPHKGYHAYAHEPLIETRPTVVTLLVHGHEVKTTIRYPRGTAMKDSFEPHKTIMAYDRQTPIFISIPQALLGQPIQIDVAMLLCSDKNCWPFSTTIDALSPVSTSANNTDSAQAYLQADKHPTLASLPLAQSQAWFTAYEQALEVKTTGDTAHALEPHEALKQTRSPASLQTFSGQGMSLEAFSRNTSPEALSRNTSPEAFSRNTSPEALSQQKQSWKLEPRYVSPSLEVSGLMKALLFGLLAGFIMNLMPCVLPVLGFKLSAFVSALGDSRSEATRIRAFREHNMFFALGIVTWFMVLALLLSWAGLAWGQLFQHSAVLFGLTLMVFLLALSMFGVFTLPLLDIKTKSVQSPRSQAFMTGAVATILATPCSGPLLGGVLAWAFGQPPLIIALVFVAVGCGMASPYIILSIWPRLVRYVPKAGAWTGTLEHIVGFFLMGTALYLFSIMPEQERLPSLMALFIAALCAWIWGQWSGPAASTRQRILVRLACVAITLGISIWALSPPAPQANPWQDFNADTMQTMLAKENLVVEFTADWCPNCKVLERTTLRQKNVQKWAQDYDAHFIRVDLTRDNAQGQALLKALGSSSIPLLALFPKGEEHHRPLVLRDIFSPAQMESALKEAFR